MIFNLMKSVPVHVGVGDYSGNTDKLVGYAWCLNKAVPVYSGGNAVTNGVTVGGVTNPQYARFYISELPTFSAEDYPYINTTTFKNRLLQFTRDDYLYLMSQAPFETVGDFPFISLLHRTDRQDCTPYGYQWVGSVDRRAYAICNLTDDDNAPKGVEYFDLYLSTFPTGAGAGDIEFFIRYSGETDFNWGAGGIYADNVHLLHLSNIDQYLVLTETPTR